MDTERPDFGVFPKRYVAKNIEGTGWSIWDRDEHKWWGSPFREYPEDLLAELNGPMRPEILAELSNNP